MCVQPSPKTTATKKKNKQSLQHLLSNNVSQFLFKYSSTPKNYPSLFENALISSFYNQKDNNAIV